MEILKAVARYPILVFIKSRRDGIFLKASALAFVTILSLVPLLAAFSFVGEGLYDQYKDDVLGFLGRILPYSEEDLLTELDTLLEQADQVRGLGWLWFFIVSLFAFATIEEALSTIWNVSGRRPLRERILFFTLLLFWGPILLGATITSLVFVSDFPLFAFLVQEALPLALNFVGLTVLYWLAPYASVRFQSALVGGAVAALLLEILRRGFGLYVQQVREQVNIVYDSLGLALFFMISIELVWTIVLLGCELAYTTQHFGTLLRTQGRPIPPHRRWVSLAALCLIASRFYRQEPLTSRELLAEHLGIPPDDLEAILTPLVAENYLCEQGGHTDAYLLAGDPRTLSVRKVFALYATSSDEMLQDLPTDLAGPLESLRARVLAAELEAVGEISLASLVDPAPEEGREGVDGSASVASLEALPPGAEG